jgi:hypothetical protein
MHRAEKTVRRAGLWFLLLAVVTLAAAIGTVWLLAPAQGATSVPPECVHWRILDNSGAGPLVRALVCGTGSLGESPARDDSNWATVIVDGDQFRTSGCGKSWSDPCVILWPASPQGVKVGT